MIGNGKEVVAQLFIDSLRKKFEMMTLSGHLNGLRCEQKLFCKWVYKSPSSCVKWVCLYLFVSKSASSLYIGIGIIEIPIKCMLLAFLWFFANSTKPKTTWNETSFPNI